MSNVVERKRVLKAITYLHDTTRHKIILMTKMSFGKPQPSAWSGLSGLSKYIQVPPYLQEECMGVSSIDRSNMQLYYQYRDQNHLLLPKF